MMKSTHNHYANSPAFDNSIGTLVLNVLLSINNKEIIKTCENGALISNHYHGSVLTNLQLKPYYRHSQFLKLKHEIIESFVLKPRVLNGTGKTFGRQLNRYEGLSKSS